MAKIKVFYTEGYSVWIVKEPVIIDTDDYPELEGLSNEEIEKYLTKNADTMKSSEGDEPNSYSLYDECYEQDEIRNKETGNEVSFQIEELK
jgi:hypothetical protein